jgi:hypothetical protein
MISIDAISFSGSDDRLLDTETDPHSFSSTLRERIVEHIFIGEILRRLWQVGVVDVEILRSEFDSGGYDIVLSYLKVVRHVQFKTMRLGGKRVSVNVNIKLADKPSGCVIWIIIDDELQFKHYHWFGGLPGEPLPEILGGKTGKHSKGDSTGKKAERPNQRLVPLSRFERLDTLDQVLARLFGIDVVAKERVAVSQQGNM